jgi:DNA segregation ATPase FtsK/SpoIIIE, S-DNA-T family
LARKSSSGKKGDLREEALGILLIALGILCTLSMLPAALLTRFGSQDDQGQSNLVGLLGQFINESLKDIIGVLAYALPVMLALWGWRLFSGRGSNLYARVTVYSLVLALGAVILIGLGGEQSAGSLDWNSGRLGTWLAGFLSLGLGPVGAYVAVAAALLLFLIFYSGLSFRTIADWGVMAASFVAGMAVSAYKAVSDRPEKKKKPAREKKKTVEKIPEPEEPDDNGPESVFEPPSGELSGEPGEDFQFELGMLGDEPPVPEEQNEKQENARPEFSDPEAAPRMTGVGGEGGYELPPLDILESRSGASSVVSREELEKVGRVLMSKLADFNVQGELGNITRGPQVSTFEIKPAPGVKVNRIAALADDLAMAMRAKKVRIMAPIPGKGVVGVELPNPVLEMVSALDVFSTDDFRGSSQHVPIGLGKDLEGRIRVADLTRMPHLLIAGTTGSGKSVCMNMIIASILFNFGPDQVRLLMIDPKMIELNLYNDIPHLLHPVVTEAREAAGILKWATAEMETRYRLLSRNSVRSIEEYNAKLISGKPIKGPDGVLQDEQAPMPYIIILVDELSDLMCSDVKNEIEAGLVRLAQMARAVGIHLVVATQRPSVDVITGLIKANFPSRISFQVYSKIDSRTILDVSGAEQLLRNGDMLFVAAGQSDPMRIQGAFLSGGEAEKLAEHWREQPWLNDGEDEDDEDGPRPRNGILDNLTPQIEDMEEAEDRDELFAEAVRLVVRHDQGSTSLIQRRLKVGYARAGRIVDQMERAGIVGPPDGSKPREVLIADEDLAGFGIE